MFGVRNRRYAFDIFGNRLNVPQDVELNAIGLVARAGAAVGSAVAANYMYTGDSGGLRGTKRPSDAQLMRAERNKVAARLRQQGGVVNDNMKRQKIGKNKISEREAPKLIHEKTSNPTHRRISTGNMGGGAEVPVMPPPSRISKIVPDYFTIDLPYYQIVQLTGTNTGASANINLRMNSIYDPIVGTLSDRQPQGRDQWALTFQYYRVLKSQIKLTLLTNAIGNALSRPSQDTWVFAYELDEQLGNTATSVDALMTTKHAKRTMISVAPQTASGNGTNTVYNPQHVNMVELHHLYNPNTWDHHVQELGQSERWTPIGENPAFIHNMALRLIGLDNQAIADGQWEMMVQVNYTVQFREARHQLIKETEGTYTTVDAAPTT